MRSATTAARSNTITSHRRFIPTTPSPARREPSPSRDAYRGAAQFTRRFVAVHSKFRR